MTGETLGPLTNLSLDGSGIQASEGSEASAARVASRWFFNQKGSYVSYDGYYFSMRWGYKTADSEFHRAKVPLLTGLHASDGKGISAREQVLGAVEDNLQACSDEDQDQMLDGIDTDAGRAMSWEAVEKHFKQVWPKEGEVAARLAEQHKAIEAEMAEMEATRNAEREALEREQEMIEEYRSRCGGMQLRWLDNTNLWVASRWISIISESF